MSSQQLINRTTHDYHMSKWKGQSPLEDALMSVIAHNPPSQSAMTAAKAIAVKYQREYKHVIYYTIKFLSQCDSNEKINIIYFMDTTIRYYKNKNSDIGNKILSRFADKLNDAFIHFKNTNTNIKAKLTKVWTHWKTREIFPSTVLDKVAHTCDMFAKPETNANDVLDVLNAPAPGHPGQQHPGHPGMPGMPPSGYPPQQMFGQPPPGQFGGYQPPPNGAYGRPPPPHGAQSLGLPPSLSGPPPSLYPSSRPPPVPSPSNGVGGRASRWGAGAGAQGHNGTHQQQPTSTYPPPPQASGSNNTMIGRKRPRDSGYPVKSSNNDDDEQPPGKCFIGGIHADAHENDVKQYLEQYGPLESFFLVKNTQMGGHKGYGFAVFITGEIADKIAAGGPHMILGKKTDIKKCQKRSELTPGQSYGGKKPCFSWAKGMCRNGDACQYSHDGPEGVPQARPKNPCFNWAKGHCRNGDECRYSHDAEKGSGPVGPIPGSTGFGASSSGGASGGASGSLPYSGGYGGSGSGTNNGAAATTEGAYTGRHKTTGSNRAPMAFTRSFGPKTGADNSNKQMPADILTMMPRMESGRMMPVGGGPPPNNIPTTAPPVAPSQPSIPVASVQVTAPPAAPVFKAKVAKKASIFKKKGAKKKKKANAAADFDL